MDSIRNGRGRGTPNNDNSTGPSRPQFGNRRWVAPDSGSAKTGAGGSGHSRTPSRAEGDRWERGGSRGGRARGAPSRGTTRRFLNATFDARPSGSREVTPNPVEEEDQLDEEVLNLVEDPTEDPDPETPEEREKFYQEVRYVPHSSLTRTKIIQTITSSS